MNVYIIPAWYQENKKDLTASFIREQAHALFKRGHNITIIILKVFSLRNIKEYLVYKERVWEDNGIETKYYKRFSFIPLRFEKLYHKIVSSTYYRVIKKSISADLKSGKSKPDLIHAHVGPWCSYFVIPAAKKLGLPIVTTEHYSGLTNGKRSDLKFIREKYVIENSDLTIFVGTNFKRYVLETTNANGNTIVIPNSIDPSMFADLPTNKHNNIFRFITACRLVPLKKVEHIIEAFHKEFDKESSAEYIIAGDGPMREQLETLVHELGEDDRIHFTGSYSRNEMPSLFSKCDAFVLTSEFETFGIVYLEAMMCGLPCIGTKGQGSDDIINNSNGIQVEYGDIEELAKAMRHLYEHKNTYSPSFIKDYVIENFSSDKICALITKQYELIVNKNKE